ncbi:hypothetical protein GCM10010922_02920 [Microbacterium sorbitolivorans]|uniref:Uncharacterized protein n=1 Tax=Microbacterium sorbitolivorans TaxID=1867410 RepID=A0A367Y6Q2_9MICO|nr:hypothetical protein [Microbacterium sorbitolivorans]RCK61545.1 hypothetical protein DTO57_02605 [Microbacterium sorbitolivorans]GGF31278.1 hypothetical protein GCM10010922_02920 [Microbacterium sorbitolivorans]
MPFLQVTYYVSESTMAKIMTGAAKRFGSVVRDHQHITEHLKEISVEDVTNRVAQAAKGNMSAGALIGIGLAGLGVAVATGIATYAFTKKATKKKLLEATEVPEVVSNYNHSLATYHEAIQHGALAEGHVDNLAATLARIEKDQDAGAVKLELSPDQASQLVGLLSDYTKRLADANAVTLEEDLVSDEPTDVPIIDLQQYLAAQKRIIRDAA